MIGTAVLPSDIIDLCCFIYDGQVRNTFSSRNENEKEKNRPLLTGGDEHDEFKIPIHREVAANLRMTALPCVDVALLMIIVN